MYRLIVLLIVILTWIHLSLSMRSQKVSASGQLLCGPDPAANIRVKLIDYDTGPDPDDELDSGYTDHEGKFSLKGSTRELSNIDAFLKIYHDCNDHGVPCQRKWKIQIPDKYINSPKTFVLGKVNLEVELDEEERDCVH